MSNGDEFHTKIHNPSCLQLFSSSYVCISIRLCCNFVIDMFHFNGILNKTNATEGKIYHYYVSMSAAFLGKNVAGRDNYISMHSSSV